jgi:hypothetical protein
MVGVDEIEVANGVGVKVGGSSPRAGDGNDWSSMTTPLARGVAVGTAAKGSGVLVGVEVEVGVTDVGVGLGSCRKNGRTRGGLVRVTRTVKPMRRDMKLF